MLRKLILPTAAAAILLTGCSTGDVDKLQSDVAALQKDVAALQAQLGVSGGTSSEASASGDAGQTSAQAKDFYSLGEQFAVNGVTYTVTDGGRKPQLSETLTAKDGYEFVLYNVDIQNTGSEDYHYSQSDFSLVTGAGEIEDNYLIIDTQNKYDDLGNGELATNGKRSGFVAFQVPQGDQPTELRFESIRSKEANFKVKLQ